MQTQGDGKIPITVELQDMFSYSPAGLIIVISMLALVVIYAIYCIIRKKVKERNDVAEVNHMHQQRLEEYRKKYIQMLLNLRKRYKEGHISERQAYQELSRIIRHFVYSVTGIRVQNYTLEELRKINIPNLYYLIGECYRPEFDTEGRGNIEQSIDKARKVIEEWK